jgi:hypothetical protein
MSRPTPKEIKEYRLLSDEALVLHRLLMSRGVLPRPEGSPRGAYDAMNSEVKRVEELPPPKPEGVAHDQEAIQELLQVVNELAPNERSKILALVERIKPGCFASETKETAEDEPAPFPGRPRPGGAMDPLGAEDAVYAEALAAGARVRVDPYIVSGHDRRQARQAIAMDGATSENAEASWDAWFGQGRRKPIGVV